MSDPTPPGDQPGDQPGNQPGNQPGGSVPPPPPGYGYGQPPGQAPGQAPGQPPGQPPYGYGAGQPPYGYPGPGYGPPPPSNQKALWSLIIGIVAVPLACYACLGWIGIASIVLGSNAKKEIAATGGIQPGIGQAQAGVILGWIGAVLGTLVLIANIALFATGNSTVDYNFGS